MPEVLFQTYIYMLVKKRFGWIPIEMEWVKFFEFMKTCMREEREKTSPFTDNKTLQYFYFTNILLRGR